MKIDDIYEELFAHSPEERVGGSWLLGFDVWDALVDAAGWRDDLLGDPEPLLLGYPVWFTLADGVMRYRSSLPPKEPHA